MIVMVPGNMFSPRGHRRAQAGRRFNAAVRLGSNLSKKFLLFSPFISPTEEQENSNYSKIRMCKQTRKTPETFHLISLSKTLFG